MASAVMAAVSGRGMREARGWRGTAPLSFEWGSEQGGKGRRAAAREEKRTAALGMVGRGDGGRLGVTLTGGSHLEVRERESGRGMDWAGSVGLIGLIRRFWANLGLAEKKEEEERWAGLERMEKREDLFVLFF